MSDFLPHALQAFLLVVALSTDTFVACFAYGANHIRIPPLSLLMIDGVCTGLLAVSLLAGSCIRPLLPASLTTGVSFAILALLGLARLCDSAIKAFIRRHKALRREWRFSLSGLRFILHIYADPEEADADRSKSLSPAEAAPLAAAMSLDGLVVGFGAGVGAAPPILVLLFSFAGSALAVKGGCALGNRMAARLRFDPSWISGALLLLLAFLKL